MTTPGLRIRLIVAMLAIAPPALAQEVRPDSLTLQAAVDRALAGNPALAAARLAGAVNQAGLAVARERLNPEATVEFEKETPKQSYGVALPIELGGKRAKRIAVGDATVAAGEAELAASVAQVRNDVRRAYFDVLIADARSKVFAELRDLSRRVNDAAEARFESGDAPRLEVLQVGLTRAEAENQAIAAESSSAAARTRLNALLGQPLATVQTLTTPLDVGNALTTDAALSLARSGNAELAVLDRQIQEQRAKLELARALRVPDLVPSATLTHDAEPEFTWGWRAGVAMTIPLFTTHKAGVLVEQTTLDQLLAGRQATEVRITSEVTAFATTAEAQRQAYLRYRESILPRAAEVEQLAQDSYRLGQTGLAALLQALQASRDVRLRSLDAMSQFQTALADLEHAIGVPLP